MPFTTRSPKAIIPGKVWQAYHDDDFDQPEPFIFTENPAFTNSSTDPETFDVRDLDVPSAYLLLFAQPPSVDSEVARHRGMSLKSFQKTPDYKNLVLTWTKWFEVDQPRLVRAALKEHLLISGA